MELAAPCLGFLALQRYILLLSKNSPLILVFFIIWKILKTFTVWQVISEWLQRSLRYLLDPRKWFSKAESVQQKSETSPKETKTIGKGTSEDAAHQTPYQRLRQLLCKEVACQVCRRVAQEAWQLIYWQRADGGRYAKLRVLLSPWSCQESKVSTITSVEEEQESCLWTSSVTSASVGPVCFGPEGTASTDTTSQHVASVPMGQKASKPTPQDRKTRDSFSEELGVYLEDFSSWSSSTYETSSISTWTDSSGLSTIIFSRLKSRRSRKHHKSFLQKQKSSRGSPKRASPEAAKVEEMYFTSVPVSFMKEAMIQSLESHWVAKRLQHLLGMSWVLLRSLRSFMPSAPVSSSGRPLGVTVVVRRPRVLAFVAAKTKKKLELHLKKRVHLKHWQLPRRVQEALRHMKPPPPPLPKSETSLVQKPGRKAKRSVVTGPPLLQRSLDVIQMKVKLHLAKKCVEIQAEAFPEVALRSWRCSVWLDKRSLPKLASHADKPSQARLVFLPFVLPQDAKKMELAVQRWRLSSCWDLGKRYVESLVTMAPPPASSKPLPGRRTASEFSGAQTPFLQQRGRQTLEAHVRKKRLQHEWGLPSVIRRSLKAFLPSVVPWGSVLRKTRSRLETLPRKLGFLPEDTCILLEFHLQRMKLQQRWGLPRRVLETYRRLFPEVPSKEKRVAVKPFSQQPRLGIRPLPGRPKQEEEKARKIQGLELCPVQPPLMLKTKVLKKLQVHLTKKHLEVCLQSFPAAPRISWRSSRWSQKRPLPKLILPGLMTPQIRVSCSSCDLAAMGRIESALQRGRLSSLWGLSLKYMEAVTEMATVVQQDAERPRPPDGTKEFSFRFAEGKTPFFQPSAREVLEMHLRKKRIQHQWGLPSLAQRSLQSFIGHMSPLRPSKAVTQASILPRELLFLPRKVTNVLEFHLQRMKLQQRWGMPRRVLESCRRLFPGLFYKEKTTLLVKQYSRKPSRGIKTRAGGLVKPRLDIQKTRGVGLRPAQSLCRLSLQALKKLEVHLTKKHLEVCLETFPAVPRFSWRCVWLSTSKPLPKLILPGLKTLQTRRSCLSFDLEAMGRIEVALQRGRLVSLWGLGLKYVETLAAMCPGGPSAKFKEVPFEFSEVKSLFFKNAVKENLEMHIRKKRLQHEWGYSTLVQRSLRSLIGEAPQRHRGLLKALTQTSLLHLELRFLSEPVKQNLELHIQRMKLQRRWGVPQKVHRSVKLFHSLVPEEKPQAKFGLGETQKVLLPKNEGCLEELLRYTLETHLKKKSLEIKFQLIGYGPIKRAFLPKRSSVSSEIKPRTSCLYFVEQEIVEKINVNIKRKHLMHLWGLPSIYTKSLNKMFGNVIAGSPLLEMSKLRRWTLEKNIGRESQAADAMGSRTKELRFSRKGPCFVQIEILDLLETHVRRKKLQHEWGLPSTVQKSLQAFAAHSLEPERLLEGLGIATSRSSGALKVTIKITKNLFFLDVAIQKLLEAHMKTRTATHRWGLPKRVQESLKMFLPPAASSQVEGDQGQAETPRHAYNRLFQTAAKQQHKAENIHCVTTVKRALPKADLLGETSREKTSRSGRETQKRTPGKETTLMFVKEEDLEFMGLHVRHKRIQHEWGLPTLVQKSLQAFAPVPPELRERSLTGLALESLENGRKASRVVHVPRPMIRVLVPRQYFLRQEAKDHLEYHVSRQTREHKWGLPRLIQDSLRAMVPPPQVPDEKTHCESHLGFHLQEGVHASRSRKEGPPWWTSSWKEATIKPMKNIHQRKPDTRPSSSFLAAAISSPEVKLLSYVHMSWDLLEFHIIHKKIQHAWGLPSAILKSLGIFAPFPLDLQKHTRRRAQRSPEDKADVKTKAQQLWFLNTSTKQHLETSVRTMVTKHRWEIPKRIQHLFHPFLPPRPSSQVLAQPLWSHRYRRPQDTSLAPQISAPLQKAKHHLGAMEIPQRALQVKTTETMRLCPKTMLSFLPVEESDLLEFHIRQKKIQHTWGLPSMVLRSLHAFAPNLLQLERTSGKTTSRKPRRETRDVQILTQDLDFLSIKVKERLEAHLRHRTSKHRWGLPERVRRSLRAFLPPRSPSHPGMIGSQHLLPLRPKSLQTTEDIYEPVMFMPEPKQKNLEKPRSKVGKRQRRSRQTKTQTCFGTKMVLSFLSESSRNLLEFHIQRKKIQHTWGLPSMVLRSLHVFAPYLLQPERTSGKTKSKKPRRDKIDVQILTQDLIFLSIEVKERLEAHLRHRTSEHRWGLPERVQRSLRAFLPPRTPHPGITGFHPLLSLPPKSLQTTEDVYEPVMFKPEPKQKILVKRSVGNKRQGATGRSQQTKGQSCSGTKTGLSFLPEGSQNLLEFHIQWKRIQHAWGLPSAVLQSLQAFAPHLFKAEKCTTGTMAKVPPCDGGEVQILSQDLDFLSVEEKERLEAHLRHLTSEHRWGLPERVQRSLRAFLPPRSPPCSEMTGSLPLSPYPPTATYVQPSWTSKGTEDPQILPPSSPSSYIARDYMPNVGKPERRGSFQKVKSANGRITPRVKNKTPLPGFKAKMVSWQKEDGSQRTTEQRGTLEGLTPPPKPSAGGRELKRSPKIPSYLSCHSSASKETSISSSNSDRQPKWSEKKKKKKKKEVHWKRGEALVIDSSLLAEDNEAQDSPWSSGDDMEESEESSGDDMSCSSLQEPEAAKIYCRPWEVRPYRAPTSQLVSYFFPHHVHVPNSSYEDVVARRYRQARRERHATQSSRLQRRGRRLMWREFLGHSLGEATWCQAFFRTQMLEHWSSECERFLCLQHPSSSRQNRSSTEDHGVQPPKESRKGPLQKQDSIRTDVELQVHHESCSLTLKADSKEEGRMESVTFSIAKERSLLSLETRSQGSPEDKDVRVDDWDQGRRLEVKWEDQNKGAEESLREEMGSWRLATSSAVRHPPNLAEDTALSLVAPSEEPSDLVYSTVAGAVMGSTEDHGVLKPGKIPERKDVVLWLKRQTPVDLTQAEAMGQDSGVQRPLPRGMTPISCSPGRPPEARKKKQVKVSWSANETRQECLVIRRLVFDPKLSQALEVPRQGVHKTPQEQRFPDSEKMTILGNILEKKLNLQQGLFIWRQSPRPNEKEGRGRKRDKRERGGGGQAGRLPQPSSTSMDKQSSVFSTILQGKLHLCRDILKGKLCFWKKSQEKPGGLSKSRRTGKSGGANGKKSGGG